MGKQSVTAGEAQAGLFRGEGRGRLPPLADRIRPAVLTDFVGQKELLGEGRLLATGVESGHLFSMILWGPPGSGKTTLARLLAGQVEAAFHELTAADSNLKAVRVVLMRGRSNRELGRATVLFIDEIHRFNKAQQDALLPAVEEGAIILIGATTENPSFEVISPLLSRCQVVRLKPYSAAELGRMLDRALAEDVLLSGLTILMASQVRDFLIASAGGDARKLLNAMEIAAARHSGERRFTLTREDVGEALQQRQLLYDRAGDYHYDTISAFIKSVRGSDPDAAIYWLVVMLEGGEKPEFIARRLVILASEDIGNADPTGLVVATSAMQAVHMVGMPEAGLVLAQVTTYLAAAPKSNAATLALKGATAKVRSDGVQAVPLHLRNAATGLVAEIGYGKDYVYPHGEPDHFTAANYFPEGLSGEVFYRPTNQGHENFVRRRLEKLWSGRY